MNAGDDVPLPAVHTDWQGHGLVDAGTRPARPGVLTAPGTLVAGRFHGPAAPAAHWHDGSATARNVRRLPAVERCCLLEGLRGDPLNEFERLVAEGERRLQLEELRRSGRLRRPFFESWWFSGLMSLQVWPRVLLTLADPQRTSDRVWEAVVFSLLFLLFLPFWVRARRKGAARREELWRELEAEQFPPGEGDGQRPAAE